MIVRCFIDGRRVIDGKVEVRKEPHEMWCNLLINLFIKSIATRFDGSIRSTHERHTNGSFLESGCTPFSFFMSKEEVEKIKCESHLQ